MDDAPANLPELEPAESIDPAAVAHERLGEPDAVYAVSRGRFFLKFSLGLALVAYGLIGSFLAWQFGHFRVDHITLLVLFAPPITGLALLRHVYATRGLRVLVYPTGLLRVQREAAEAYSWEEITAIRMRADAAEANVLAALGEVTDAWFAVESPVFRVGNVGLTILRADGVTATLSPALADFPDLAERVQRATFRQLWPETWQHFQAGGSVEFGPLILTPEGLMMDQQRIKWSEALTLRVTSKHLILSGRKRKIAVELDSIPNPHLLLGLVEAIRLAGLTEPGSESADSPAETVEPE